MLQYPLEMPGGHLVIRHDAQALLLDTGSPVSVGRRSSYDVLDRVIPVLQRYQGMNVEQWSEIIGINIEALLGSDVLSRYAVAIDPEAGHVSFDHESPGPRTRGAGLDTVAGMPVIEIGMAGRKLRALLHTGATLSCLRDVDTRDHPCVGVTRGCFPGVGEYTTELRRVPLVIADRTVSLECGSLPWPLERALRPADVHGIVGTDLLRTFVLGWGPGFSELRLAPRRTMAAPIRLARLRVGAPVGNAS